MWKNNFILGIDVCDPLCKTTIQTHKCVHRCVFVYTVLHACKCWHHNFKDDYGNGGKKVNGVEWVQRQGLHRTESDWGQPTDRGRGKRRGNGWIVPCVHSERKRGSCLVCLHVTVVLQSDWLGLCACEPLCMCPCVCFCIKTLRFPIALLNGVFMSIMQ